MSQDVTIGIDLGTSNSCVATVMGGRPQVLANAYGEPTTASVVAFGQDSSIAVGNQAKARVILDPKHTVSSAKRLIGRYYFSEEVKKVLACAEEEAERLLHPQVSDEHVLLGLLRVEDSAAGRILAEKGMRL